MCMTEKKGPLSGLGDDHMHHGEHHMERHMECCGQNSFPLIGDKLLSIQVKTTQGMINLPGDYRGKWLVLFSHPADFTPVCTTEFVAFEKRRGEFEELSCDLIGLSIDQVFSHMKWTEWIRENLKVEIKFPIIAVS